MLKQTSDTLMRTLGLKGRCDKIEFIIHLYINTAENKPTFVDFVDFEKAFDWVNRDLLALKLLKAGVNGKFYQAVKSLY